MTKKRNSGLPKLTLDKATGQSFVRLNGVFHYLGKYEEPETQQKALHLIAEWLVNARKQPVEPEEITVNQQRLTSQYGICFFDGYYMPRISWRWYSGVRQVSLFNEAHGAND